MGAVAAVPAMSSLEEYRAKIDQIDTKLVHLINERAKQVVEVGKLKMRDANAPGIYAPDRERMILDKIQAMNEGPLPDRCLVAVYRELMSGSFFLERPLRIGYLGPPGSFSHSAAMLKFGQSVEYEALPDIGGVFDEIGSEHCDLGIVPVENSIAGGVIETLDALIDSSVLICGEVLLAVHHNLLSRCGLEDIETVYSKPEALAQCRNWLATALPNVGFIATASTAQAAEEVAKVDKAAAVGSVRAAEIHGLNILCENIEDRSNNVTRFCIIGREPARRSGKDKTSLVFATAHKAGALVDVLQVFRAHGVNLTNIESRPSKKREREYYFFVDCEGHRDDEHVIEAMAAAKQHCLQFSVLGSFPKASEIL